MLVFMAWEFALKLYAFYLLRPVNPNKGGLNTGNESLIVLLHQGLEIDGFPPILIFIFVLSNKTPKCKLGI